MRQVTVAIAGLGGRGRGTYARAQWMFPEAMKIVAIADIDPEKVEAVARDFNIPPEMCFDSAEKMLEQPKLADVMFICTMDRQHYGHAMPALEKGYDLLLEKPISPDMKQCKEIAETANRLGRKVVVCHVLRYTPFYQKIKEIVDSGILGEIAAITACEPVCYWHQAHSFVRGNWRNSKESSPMILQKCCHDMDILTWLSGADCKSVSSVGSLLEFKAEKAPEGAAERCVDCKYKDECSYSAVKYYVQQIRWGNTGWPVEIVLMNATEETLLEKLKTSPYGRCVYHCDNDVVDHQAVQLLMKNGITVSFMMCAFTEGSRQIHIMGTRGMLEGDMGSGKIKVSGFNGTGLDIKEYDVHDFAKDFSGHGGGDNRLVYDLLEMVAEDRAASTALTSIDKSVESHLICMAAEESRLCGGKLIDMDEFKANL